jgi:hypothetical protein
VGVSFSVVEILRAFNVADRRGKREERNEEAVKKTTANDFKKMGKLSISRLVHVYINLDWGAG